MAVIINFVCSRKGLNRRDRYLKMNYIEVKGGDFQGVGCVSMGIKGCPDFLLLKSKGKRGMETILLDQVVILKKLSQTENRSMADSVVKGLVGSVLLGPVGLVGGVLLGKKKTKVEFSIHLKDSRKALVSSEVAVYSELSMYVNG